MVFNTSDHYSIWSNALRAVSGETPGHKPPPGKPAPEPVKEPPDSPGNPPPVEEPDPPPIDDPRPPRPDKKT